MGSAMLRTPLYDTLTGSAARMGEYSGVETAAVFRDATSEFRALVSGCAIYDLGWRAKIVLTGTDRVRWLNGMVTNNIKDLQRDRGNYNFVLNPQGRILGDLYAYNRGESILIDTERLQTENLLKLFDHYIIMDDVDAQDRSDAIAAIGLQGQRSREILKQAGITIPDMEHMQIVDLTWHGVAISVIRMASKEFLTFEIWAPAAAISELWKAIVEAGAEPVGSDALEQFRVMIGFPKYGIDIRERDLPQETEQRHALNFSKGCYVGQEIVERIRSRGNVHRTFHGFVLSGDTPERGAKLQADGKEVGELTSVNRIPAPREERPVALGYIRREALERGAKITYSGGEAQPAKVPFSIAS